MAFAGDDRFTLLERLGAGSMGEVYRARDQERGADVALKRLRDLDAARLYRFKREFRALADVVHPNLVTLYELFATGEGWFFTMELIDGVDFRRWVVDGERGRRDEPDTVAADPTMTFITATLASDEAGSTGRREPRHPPLRDPAQLDRLRAATEQLARGAEALHARGQLHRDLKPSNVRVQADGRVVVLDFGIVATLGEPASRERMVVGTPAYMAPEQAAVEELSPATDWYAVGVMIYEALTGRLPYPGSVSEMLAGKRAGGFFLPPSAHGAEVAPELEALCLALLQREPAARPSGSDVLAVLAGDRPAPGPAPRVEGDAVLVGRDDELGALASALADARAGHPRTIYVSGDSGMGKTALVNDFLTRARSGGARVLRGRCYERESVPYKALDELIEALADYLSTLDDPLVTALLPGDLQALSTVFPALRRVGAIARASGEGDAHVDPRHQRRRAIAALRELITAVAGDSALVMFVDDLQWSDPESVLVLGELARMEKPARALLILAHREDGHERNPAMRALASATPEATAVRVGPLPPEQGESLARALLGDDRRAAAVLARRVAVESGGSPLFAAELVRYLRHTRADAHSSAGHLTFDAVLRSRLNTAPPPARELLEILAVAGRPITQRAARRAAGLPPDDRTSMAYLRAERLARTTGAGQSDLAEPLHDRIREAVTRGLADARAVDCHSRLAGALAEEGDTDPELLATHLEAAGDLPAAAARYAQAARDAMAALAFERAADLYERSIELAPPGPVEAAAVWSEVAVALSHAGRPTDAAEAFVRAAEHAGAREALELRRRAAEHLLHGGRIDDGIRAIGAVLEACGIHVARTPRRALAGLVARRAWLRLRGLGYTPRDESEVAQEELVTVDVCWSAGVGLGLVNPILGAEFQSRNLLAAVRCGEEQRVALALAVEACFRATAGSVRALANAVDLLDRSREILDRGDDPMMRAWVLGTRGFVSWLRGAWREGRSMCEQAIPILEEHGAAWALASTRLYRLWLLLYLGDGVELSRAVPDLRADAIARGDICSLANMSTGWPNFAWLLRGRPDDARTVIAAGMAEWTPDGYQLQRFWQTMANAHVDLYQGEGARALARLGVDRARMRRALLHRVHPVRAEMTWLEGRCALAAATEARDPAPLLATAERAVRSLAREPLAWQRAMGGLVSAGVVAARGDLDRARAALVDAARGLDELGATMLAAAARRREAELAGDPVALARADDALARAGAADPARIAGVLVPIGPR